MTTIGSGQLNGGLAAYAAAQQRAKSLPLASETTAAPTMDFGNMLAQTMATATQATRSAETASMQAMTKSADLVDVVSAVNNAELALETVVAVRDRMISAYQEILRMPI